MPTRIASPENELLAACQSFYHGFFSHGINFFYCLCSFTYLDMRL